jgi:hypothetical protein
MPLRFSRAIALAVALAPLPSCFAHAITPRNVTPAKLDPNAREIFSIAMKSMDDAWDPKVHLVRTPVAFDGHGNTTHAAYMVRETSCYALGLLMRNDKGDRQRAAEGLDAVLKEQFTDQSKPWYGTFRRTPEEPDPSGDNTVMWRNYDPNWREFVGTTLEMILVEYPDRVSADLASRMYGAIDRAIAGEMKHGRLLPTYSNIALMYGALWDFAATHDNSEDWKKQSALWIETVGRHFHEHNAFSEYNSPTYYGVDLFGLALWRSYGSTTEMHDLGARIEAVLWGDIADFYHPGLRNIAGPYDRSYGMDMETYVAFTGVWMRTLLPANKAPLPIPSAHTDHLPDLWFAPQVVILGANPPADALAKIRTYSGEHAVARQITNERRATAWIGDKVILGGEFTSLTKDALAPTQFHPATVQWRTPSKSIGWFYVAQAPKIDAIVEKTTLHITVEGEVMFRLKAAGTQRANITANKWTLPGLTVAIEGDQHSFAVKDAAHYQPNDSFEITYTGMGQMTLTVTPQ